MDDAGELNRDSHDCTSFNYDKVHWRQLCYEMLSLLFTILTHLFRY